MNAPLRLKKTLALLLALSFPFAGTAQGFAAVPPGTANQERAHPDFSFTPGRLCTAQDPDFKEFAYPEHIALCSRHVTQQMLEQVAAHYGIPESEWNNYEFDHFISLEVGGDSYSDNLWPQPLAEAKLKDQLENQLGDALKAGTMTQADAVKQIYAWFGLDPSQLPPPTTNPHAP